jgi:DNA-binding IclR family transcriptional regulator
MSWKVLGRVFERLFQSSSTKMVMMVLAEWGDDSGWLRFPCSKAQLADTAQLSTRQVQRCLSTLMKQGLIQVETLEDAATKTARTYRIDLARLAALPLNKTAAAIVAAQGRDGPPRDASS